MSVIYHRLWHGNRTRHTNSCSSYSDEHSKHGDVNGHSDSYSNAVADQHADANIDQLGDANNHRDADSHRNEHARGNQDTRAHANHCRAVSASEFARAAG